MTHETHEILDELLCCVLLIKVSFTEDRSHHSALSRASWAPGVGATHRTVVVKRLTLTFMKLFLSDFYIDSGRSSCPCPHYLTMSSRCILTFSLSRISTSMKLAVSLLTSLPSSASRNGNKPVSGQRDVNSVDYCNFLFRCSGWNDILVLNCKWNYL